MAEFLREAVNDTSPVQRAKDHVWLLESAAAIIIIIIGCFFFSSYYRVDRKADRQEATLHVTQLR